MSGSASISGSDTAAPTRRPGCSTSSTPCTEIADRLSGDLRVIAPAAPPEGMGDVDLDDRSYRDEWDLVRRLSAGDSTTISSMRHSPPAERSRTV